MPPITIMLTLLTVVILSVIVKIMLRQPVAQRWQWVVIALVLIPMHPALFEWVRLPIDAWLRQELGKSETYHWLTVWYAPLTEEPGKAVVLLVPAFMALNGSGNRASLPLLIGLCFGLGEAWLIGWKIASQVAPSPTAWYHYTPFLAERLMVCVIHGGLVGVVIWLRQRGVGWFLALGAAMLLHWLVNLPIFLVGPHVWNIPAALASVVLTLWVVVCFLAAALFLLMLGDSPQRPWGQRFFGRAICASCGSTYERPLLLAINLGTRRYERCPHCASWNWQPMRRMTDQ